MESLCFNFLKNLSLIEVMLVYNTQVSRVHCSSISAETTAVRLPSKVYFGEFPGDSVVRTLLPLLGPEFNPWWGTKSSPAVQYSKKKFFLIKKKYFPSVTIQLISFTHFSLLLCQLCLSFQRNRS